MCSCFAFPATIYPAAEHSRALFNSTHGTLVCVMFRNVCVHFDFLACMLRARRVLPGQSGGSVGGSVPTSAMFYLPACTWVTCNSYTNARSSLLHTPREKQIPTVFCPKLLDTSPHSPAEPCTRYSRRRDNTSMSVGGFSCCLGDCMSRPAHTRAS